LGKTVDERLVEPDARRHDVAERNPGTISIPLAAAIGNVHE
jgi:hypothetical protein